MDKVRIHEIAKELGIKSKDVVEKASEIGLTVKAASSAVSPEEAENLMNFILTGEIAAPKVEQKSQNDDVTPKEKKRRNESSKKEEVSEKKTVKTKEVSKEEKKPENTKEVTTVKSEPKEISEVIDTKEEKKAEKVEKEPEVKDEPKKEEKVSLSANVRKRRGLVIVKKKRRAPEPKPAEALFNDEDVKSALKSPYASIKKTATMESVFGSAGDTPKKKKKTKKAPAPKSSSQKLDIELDIQMKDISSEIESEMVVLPDFSVEKEKEEVRKKKIDPSQIKTTKKSNFLNQGIKRQTKKRRRKKPEEKTTQMATSIEIPEDIRVYEFAEKLNVSVSDVIKELFNLGVMVTKNDFLDKDSIEILADSFNISVKTIDEQEDFDYMKEYEKDDNDDDNLVEKIPVITIMGHVDHGKTSLLDYIRNSKIADKEAGGITQHVGAYMVEKNGKNITFIDTPGHEAFTQMRSRGAQATDIAIIVVAADDGVMPQTRESIDHAKAADIPIVIAVNKIDKESANPDLVKSQLAELGITPVDWGGEHEFVHISAKTGEGIDELLEVLLLQAEILELRANPDKDAKAIVIESSVEKGKGTVATVIVENGTLKVGDTVVAGIAHGKVRALLDDMGKKIKKAGPGEPAVLLGLSEVPEAGEKLVAVKSDKIAREYAKKRAEYLRQKELSKSTKVTIDELSAMIAEGALKTLPVIIKADVIGSLEAIKSSLEKLRTDETKIDIISSGIGGITESDVALASASENSIILGFNVRPTGSVKERAKSSGVEIKTYNIIYDLLDDVKALVAGMLDPVIREEQIGQAEVREVFMVPKVGAIAGCIVTDGKIIRGAKIRLIRDGVIVYEGNVSSLKRFKDDVKEVAKGYECGIGIEGFNDIKVGDYMESFQEVEEKATL